MVTSMFCQFGHFPYSPLMAPSAVLGREWQGLGPGQGRNWGLHAVWSPAIIPWFGMVGYGMVWYGMFLIYHLYPSYIDHTTPCNHHIDHRVPCTHHKTLSYFPPIFHQTGVTTRQTAGLRCDKQSNLSLASHEKFGRY